MMNNIDIVWFGMKQEMGDDKVHVIAINQFKVNPKK